MVFKTYFAKTVLDDGGEGFSPRCSNHVCCLHYVEGFEKGIGIFIIFNTGKVSQPVSSCTSSLLIECYPGLVAA